MKRTVNIAIAITVCVLVVAAPARSDVTVPTVFGDNMVLQRDVELPVWGQGAPGQKVTVSIGNASVSAEVDDKGSWAVKLPAMKCEPRQSGVTMTVKADSLPPEVIKRLKDERLAKIKDKDKAKVAERLKNLGRGNTIALKNILVGEVWLGSGQSNMEFELRESLGGKEAVAKADLPNIRLYHVPKTKNWYPNKDVNASWKVCSPETSPKFSAVLFFFGKRLHDELKVPVGLINASWGGTAIMPWVATYKDRKHVGIYYNGMIAPLHPFAIRGVTWYQGETNVFKADGMKYYDKTKKLVDRWREKWNNDKMPFYMVQLAPWSGRYVRGQLPRIWEAQVASLKIPHTGLAVTTDLVDDLKDIHPKNKIPVGNRLALWALVKDYGKKDLVYSGPLYKSMKVEGAKIRVSFAHTGGGLAVRDGKELSEFQIAGADGKFVPAKAVIDGKTVVVSADGVTEPKNVRFGWRNAANPNLINKARLPASPFKTDKWQGGTGE
ncbi:MAG: sialate O-acetylesterase [Phycisphaerae bacterium]|jgi:sialate O-acetylesterase|nr:sialate O-acetylesterase [Phycisphaerae bacterium]